MDEDFWPEDEVDGAPAPRSGAGSSSGTPKAARVTPRRDGAWPGPAQAAEAGSGPMAAAQAAQGSGRLSAEPPVDPEAQPALDEPPIYAPSPVEGATARAGVPIALPPRPALPSQPTPYAPPMPQDLPQAPESAWAQPPSSQYPMVGRGGEVDADAGRSQVQPQIQPLHGVPHQVPPAPMPRPVEPPEPPPVFLPPQQRQPAAEQPADEQLADERPAEPPAYWPQPPAEEPVYHYDVEPEHYEVEPEHYEVEPEQPEEPSWTPQNPPQEPYQLGPHQLPGPAVRPITAEEFARRRAERRPQAQAERGLRGAVRKGTFGLINPAPGRREQEYHADVELIRRNFGGLRQITVVNPKGGAGKTVAVLMLAMTFGQRRGGYVLAWDNNETQGTLGMRAQQDFHARTVRDLLRDLHLFQGAQGRVGDLSQYVRAQGEGMFEVLASDESATAGEMLTEVAFGDIRDVVSRFYKIIVVDTGNNVRAPNWQAAVDATDQLVVTMSARNDSAETAARMLDHLEQTGRVRAVRQAVTVISMPQNQRELDVPGIERHFAARTRTVVRVPYDRIIDTGEPIAYSRLSTATTDAWLKVAAAVAAGL